MDDTFAAICRILGLPPQDTAAFALVGKRRADGSCEVTLQVEHAVHLPERNVIVSNAVEYDVVLTRRPT